MLLMFQATAVWLVKISVEFKGDRSEEASRALSTKIKGERERKTGCERVGERERERGREG